MNAVPVNDFHLIMVLKEKVITFTESSPGMPLWTIESIGY